VVHSGGGGTGEGVKAIETPRQRENSAKREEVKALRPATSNKEDVDPLKELKTKGRGGGKGRKDVGGCKEMAFRALNAVLSLAERTLTGKKKGS